MRTAAAVVMLSLLALGSGLALAWWWYADEDSEPQTLPAFSLPDIEGESRHIDEWRGELMVLNFWATWCKPCREEIPMLVAAQTDYRDRGVQVLGLAVDERESVQRFAEEYGINYPVLVDAMGVVKVQDALGGGAGLPYTVIVDRDGRIRERVSGALTRAELDALLKPLLADSGRKTAVK